MGNADIFGEWDDSFGEIINMRVCTWNCMGVIDREQRKNNAAAVTQYYTIVFLNQKCEYVSCLRLVYTYANIWWVRNQKLIF